MNKILNNDVLNIIFYYKTIFETREKYTNVLKELRFKKYEFDNNEWNFNPFYMYITKIHLPFNVRGNKRPYKFINNPIFKNNNNDFHFILSSDNENYYYSDDDNYYSSSENDYLINKKLTKMNNSF